MAPFLVFDDKPVVNRGSTRSKVSLASFELVDDNINIVKKRKKRQSVQMDETDMLKHRYKPTTRRIRPKKFFKSYWMRYMSFLSAPCVIFMFESVSCFFIFS
jgi:hypothetical protein